jgi:hypothetical protein
MRMVLIGVSNIKSVVLIGIYSIEEVGLIRRCTIEREGLLPEYVFCLQHLSAPLGRVALHHCLEIIDVVAVDSRHAVGYGMGMGLIGVSNIWHRRSGFNTYNTYNTYNRYNRYI